MAHHDQPTRLLNSTKTLPAISQKSDLPALPAKTMQLWEVLKEQGVFDMAKANASLMALDVRQVKCPANIEAAMSADAPTLATVKKYQGAGMAVEAVEMIIAEAATLLNIGKNLQPHQINYLACEILQEYYWLNLADIRLIMKQGIAGKYGQIYDRLDVQVALDWLAQYVEARTGIAETKSQQAKAVQVSDNAKPMPQWFADYAAKFAAKHDAKERTPFIPDAAFWDMVEQEWNETPGERPDLEKFKALRLAQTKAMLNR